jgi:hypothetical protein
MTANHMQDMAQRLASEPGFIAYLLATYAHAEGMNWQELAEELGLDTDGFSRLAVCTVPREDRFREDVERIAQYVGASPRVLLAILRHAESLIAFQASQDQSHSQWLIAARDHDDEPEDA